MREFHRATIIWASGKPSLYPAESDEPNGWAVLKIVDRPAARMTLEDMALERARPQMMSIAGIQFLRRSIHDQEFVTQRTLPRDPANLSKECEVICHETSMYPLAAQRNLRK